MLDGRSLGDAKVAKAQVDSLQDEVEMARHSGRSLLLHNNDFIQNEPTLSLIFAFGPHPNT